MWFLCPDIVGNGHPYWASDLEAAQATARVCGWNPANVMAAPQYAVL